MNREALQVVRVIVWALALCTAPSVVMADYAIESYAIQGNATASSGGGFVLTGTIEPAAPNAAMMAGGAFALAGGLEPGVADASGEVGTASHCGSGIEEALPLLMIGLVGLHAMARRRA